MPIMDASAVIAQSRAEGRAFLDEPRAKQILEAFGIRVPRGTVIRTRAEIDRAVANLSFPVAAKIVSPDASHKSDVGGVRLGLTTATAVREAFDALHRAGAERKLRIDGVLIEEMVPRGQELVIGGIIDRRFGPVVMLGAGGIFVELFRDIVFRICPLDRIDAAEMIDDLRIAPILRGARGRDPVCEPAIIETLLSIGGENGLLVQLQDSISEIDINPLIVAADAAFACDARFVLRGEVGGEAAG